MNNYKNENRNLYISILGVCIVLLAGYLVNKRHHARTPSQTNLVNSNEESTEREIDPFDGKEVFKKGPFKGQPINTKWRRSIVKIDGINAKNYQDAEEDLVFANFSHNGKFWIAKINPNDVADVIFQKVNFDGISHLQLRFRMKPDHFVNLYSQAPIAFEPTHNLQDFIYSGEVVGREGESFDPWKGMKKNFVMAYRFVSLADKHKAYNLDEQFPIEQYKLDLRADEIVNLVKTAVKRSHKFGLNNFYHTLTQSCVTEAFDVLHKSTSKRILPHLFFWLKRQPNWSTYYMKLNGYLEGGMAKSRVENLEVECQDNPKCAMDGE